MEYRNSKGQPHRQDGPAIEYANGSKHWYQNGQRHRLDGPAIEYANGTKEWYINGNDVTIPVESWLVRQSFTVPFNDQTLALFILTF